MGRRSRRREAAGEASEPTTRGERDALRRSLRAGDPGARRKAAEARGRPGPSERPPAPWGGFPLSELVVLLAIVFSVVGLIVGGTQGRTALIAGLVLGSLAGLELAVRDHFGGYRSHSTLLAAAAASPAMVAVPLLLNAAGVGPGPLVVVAMLVVGATVFALAFTLLRRAFTRRSGGLSFR